MLSITEPRWVYQHSATLVGLKIVNLGASSLLLISYFMSAGTSWCAAYASCLSETKLSHQSRLLYECLVCHQGNLYECAKSIQRKCGTTITLDGIGSRKKGTLMAPEPK